MFSLTLALDEVAVVDMCLALIPALDGLVRRGTVGPRSGKSGKVLNRVGISLVRWTWWGDGRQLDAPSDVALLKAPMNWLAVHLVLVNRGVQKI
mmetsp:Transcript_30090/g.71605  ORF Transcript_30090/g.71605 Transcript_30090/m.71605 type:complete len:94 (-) Transcript_30090:260-541(-)